MIPRLEISHPSTSAVRPIRQHCSSGLRRSAVGCGTDIASVFNFVSSRLLHDLRNLHDSILQKRLPSFCTDTGTYLRETEGSQPFITISRVNHSCSGWCGIKIQLHTRNKIPDPHSRLRRSKGLAWSHSLTAVQNFYLQSLVLAQTCWTDDRPEEQT